MEYFSARPAVSQWTAEIKALLVGAIEIGDQVL